MLVWTLYGPEGGGSLIPAARVRVDGKRIHVDIKSFRKEGENIVMVVY